MVTHIHQHTQVTYTHTQIDQMLSLRGHPTATTTTAAASYEVKFMETENVTRKREEKSASTFQLAQH